MFHVPAHQAKPYILWQSVTLYHIEMNATRIYWNNNNSKIGNKIIVVAVGQSSLLKNKKFNTK